MVEHYNSAGKPFVTRYFQSNMLARIANIISSRLLRAFINKSTLRIPISGSNRILQEPDNNREAIVASCGVNFLALGLPLVILQIYDRILPNHAADTLVFLILGLSVVIIIDFALKALRSYIIGLSAARFGHLSGLEAMTRMMKASYGVIEAEPVSIHINRLTSLGAIAEFHSGNSRLILMDLPFIGMFLILLGLVGGVLVAIPILLFCIFALAALRRSEDLRRVFDARIQQDNRKYDFVMEVLSGIQTVKAFAMEPLIQRRFERLQQSVAEITYSSILIGNEVQSASALYGNISQFAVVGYGALLVIDGQMSIGAMACCTLLSGQILQPMLRTISMWAELQTLESRRKEAEDIFTLPVIKSGEELPKPLSGRVIMDEVSLQRGDATVFSHIDMEITPGAIIAIRGDDGSGRSSLLRLIRGEIQPSGGSVRLDEYDPAGPHKIAIQRQIGYAGSTPMIVRGTILENLTMFRTGSFRAAARDAAALIGLEDEIHALPEGYDTRIGEGVAEDIPTSFAQQIAIARVLATSPRILMLDEANSVLDRRAEAKLIKAVEALRGSLTILLVSHRPSFLALADRAYELSQGLLIPAALTQKTAPAVLPASPDIPASA